MLLSDFSIRRPLATVVIILTLMALGILALKKLRVNEIPDVEQPVMSISIAYPGASPETVEREVINRIERSLQGIPGVYEIRSTAKESSAQIIVIFNFSKNMIEAADEIRNAISTVRYKLPVEMREPEIRRRDPGAQPIMELALSSTTQSHAEISRLAEDELADKLRGVDGVAVVAVTGALKREMSVLLHADRLREYGISVAEVVDAVRSQNANAPVGRVVGPLRDQSIRLVGRIESPADFGQIIVRPPWQRGRAPGPAGRHRGRLRRDRKLQPAQCGTQRQPVGHALARGQHGGRGNGVRKLVAEINPTLPPGTKLDVVRDGGVDAQENLNNVIEALVLGAILTVLVVYVFPEFVALHADHGPEPADLRLTAFIAVWLCGFTLNFMTLLASRWPSAC
jgi:multidrug efflux pump subunit AcrB